MSEIRRTLEAARADASEAAAYCDHTRDELVRLLEQAEGRGHTRAKIKELLRHVIAAGIKAEIATGHTQIAVEWFGGEVQPEPIRFAADIARPAVTS